MNNLRGDFIIKSRKVTIYLKLYSFSELKMAGHTTDYVNKVLDKFREGSNLHTGTAVYLEDL